LHTVPIPLVPIYFLPFNVMCSNFDAHVYREGRMMIRISRHVPFFIILAALCLAACEGRPRLTVEGARAELSPVIRGEGLVYLRIVNDGGKDTLTGVRISIPGATADLHEMKGNFMVLATKLRIPAKSTLELQPMASHIMIGNMPRDVKQGLHFTLTLVFEKSGELQIPLVLMKAQPMMREHDHEHHAD
jgi:copper(I)-binding protein